jgi:hypothetical protein
MAVLIGIRQFVAEMQIPMMMIRIQGGAVHHAT